MVHDPIAALVLQRREGRALLQIGLFVVMAVPVGVVRLVVAGHGDNFTRSELFHKVLPPCRQFVRLRRFYAHPAGGVFLKMMTWGRKKRV